MPEASWTRSLNDIHPPRRIGWAPTLGYAEVDSEVAAACAAVVEGLADLGVEVEEVDPVFSEDPVVAWLTLAMAGNERALGHLRGTPEWDLVDPGHRASIDAFGARATGADVLAATDACHTANLRLVELFHRVPLLITPTVAGQTGLAGGNGTVNGVEVPNWVSFSYPFNMTRSPAGTVCAGFTADGMPIGLQVVGPQHADVTVLRGLALIEDMLDLDPIAPL
jgi:aspartyl-tRNA(Asn)/glutamyl-tRNA(Gln) amidotransferase subunit A